jgi:putative hemolysin
MDKLRWSVLSIAMIVLGSSPVLAEKSGAQPCTQEALMESAANIAAANCDAINEGYIREASSQAGCDRKSEAPAPTSAPVEKTGPVKTLAAVSDC